MKPHLHSLLILLLTLFSNFAHGYYNPVEGRWCSRDSIGEQGGVNLYGFLANDPANQVDRLGQVPTSYIPPDASKTPVVWGALLNDDHFTPDTVNPAETDKRVKVTCACACSDETKDYWQLSCKVETSFTIVLNWMVGPHVMGSGLNGKHLSSGKTAIPWDQIVGHEQHHVLSRIAQVKTVVERENAGMNKGHWTSRPACVKEKPKVASRIGKAVWDEWEHDNHRPAPGDYSTKHHPTKESPISEVGEELLPGSNPIPPRDDSNQDE